MNGDVEKADICLEKGVNINRQKYIEKQILEMFSIFMVEVI